MALNNESNLWERILQHMERRVNPHSFATWFRSTRIEDYSNGRLLVRVPTQQYRKRLTQTYGQLLAVLAELSLTGTRIEFLCSEPAPAPPVQTQQAKLDFDAVCPQLIPRYTFDTFVVGGSNQFAHAAALAVAEQPLKAAKSYNPLFLYGGTGLGKTHLMHAIGHALLKRNPQLRLTYVRSEKFTNEVIASLRFDRMPSFRERFRTMDVLMVDDIQFIAPRERTQEEFFHTFNELHDQGKQIVISSDCPPKDIPSIEERLRSRFEWGLIADIQPPDLETKIAILQKKAESERVVLADEVAEFIARAIKSNVRELEGALIRLLAVSAMTGVDANLATAQQVLRNVIETQAKKISIEEIQKRVGEQYGMHGAQLKVRSNTKAIAFPRQIAMYLVKQLTHASLPEIGRQFGNKHHTTVLHSINKIEVMRRNDKDLNRQINKLLDSFG